MATPFDDQTDEDYFDKLINDDDDDDDVIVAAAGSCSDREDIDGNEISSSSDAREAGSKATGVKVVQWSSFNVGSSSSSMQFGSDSEFLAESSEDLVTSSNEQITNANVNANGVVDGARNWGNTQQDAALDADGTENWENMYPGWKYDYSTGQWCQTESLDSGSGVETGNYNVSGDGLVSEGRSEISYSQYSVGDNSVVGTVAEDLTKGNVANWNQVSSMGYPSNMVFDPQYPKWYYDTNTQQWFTLESYNQTMLNLADKVPEGADQMKVSEVREFEQNNVNGFYGSDDSSKDWNACANSYSQHDMWQAGNAIKNVTGFAENKQNGNYYSSPGNAVNGANGFQSFVPKESIYQFCQPKVQKTLEEHLSYNYQMEQNSVDYSLQQFQTANASSSQFSYGGEARSSVGRPPHALVTFGFGGKLIVMKESSSLSSKLDCGNQGSGCAMVAIHNLMEVMMHKVDALSGMNGGCGYFNALRQHSFPSPLAGGNASAKDVCKWLDEKIAYCEASTMDLRKGEAFRLLLSLLKISCQHYGKLRSPFGVDPSVEENDGPGSAITKLFTSAKTNNTLLRDYGSSTPFMKDLPSEGQIMTTAVEVQNLLISGRRKEALQCARAGQLWGPAFVLAAQLGEKYYVETVKHMAHYQFKYGSPLRTLCLLIAGQPADVFTDNNSANSSLSGPASEPQQTTKSLGNMLDDWKENLAIITANRTHDDELVIVHLGDCLWKERGDITAAHTCYLVAEANFESYSDTARLCLIGSDHWRCPRTYACPEAIQRTEIYEYAKMLGNSQFILLQFQPYKLVYAYMLAEVGKVSESLRYCQASLKLLKNSSRASEVEMWKSSFSSLEERLRTHQQGGYSTNLAPGKLVGKLFTSIDRSIHRMISGPPSPLPPMPPSSVNGKESYTLASSQSAAAMSSLIPSASAEGINELTGDSNRKTMHTRSVSEPDFGTNLKQDRSEYSISSDSQSKVSPSRFGRIGSQLLQSVGWLSRSRQAKLGESNKFYYDEKLKRWVEEGAEPPAEEAALRPPPTTASLLNSTPDYNVNNALKSPGHFVNGPSEAKSPSLGHSAGIPPLSPSTNQFSARGKMGVRSRYVDTFNKGSGGTSPNPFVSRSVPLLKPIAGAKFLIPTTPATPDGQIDNVTENGIIHQVTSNGQPSTSSFSNVPFTSPSPLTPTPGMQRYQSMNNISPSPETNYGSISSHTRASSWSGDHGESFNHKMNEPFRTLMPISSLSNPNGRNLRDELKEVAL